MLLRIDLAMVQEKQKECSWNTSSKGKLSLESLLGSSICIPKDNLFLAPISMMQNPYQKLLITPILEDIRGLKFQNKIGAAFGSYGWSGESVKNIESHLAQSKIPVVREGIKCKWQPRKDDLAACRAFGRELGEATKSA